MINVILVVSLPNRVDCRGYANSWIKGATQFGSARDHAHQSSANSYRCTESLAVAMRVFTLDTKDHANEHESAKNLVSHDVQIHVIWSVPACLAIAPLFRC